MSTTAVALDKPNDIEMTHIVPSLFFFYVWTYSFKKESVSMATTTITKKRHTPLHRYSSINKAYLLMIENGRCVCLLSLAFCKDDYEILQINCFLPVHLNKNTITKYSSCCSQS